MYSHKYFFSQISTGQSITKAFRMYTKIKLELKAKQNIAIQNHLKLALFFAKQSLAGQDTDEISKSRYKKLVIFQILNQLQSVNQTIQKLDERITMHN